MRIQTTITPKAYLSAMKERMGSRLAWGAERFTGCFLGRFFYVTHHAGYEWNRQITNQKNAAMGIVKKTDTGCEVRCIRFQGVLCPQYLIVYLLIFSAYLLGTWPVLLETPILMFLNILIIVVTPLLTTLFETFTDGSIEGRKNLMGLLFDPTDHFSYLNHRNEID